MAIEAARATRNATRTSKKITTCFLERDNDIDRLLSRQGIWESFGEQNALWIGYIR
jgi:hypothetical protein